MKLNNRIWSIPGLLLAFFLTMNAGAETVYRVKSFDTLNRVVKKFYPNSKYPKEQIMIAVLVKNPTAFIGGNINRLLKGKRLVLPNDSEISQVSDVDAQLLISQHARFFREGITGDFSLPSLNNEADRDKTIAVVKKQTKKITQLEDEGNKLKKQLENLFKQKQKRDEELKQLESQIKQYALEKNSKPLGSAEQIEKNNEKLKETNEILNQKLVESKSDLAENERSTMALERKLSNLRERMDQDKNGVDSSATSINKTQSEAAVGSSVGETFAKLKDKYFWILPLLLIAALFYLLWLIGRWFFGRTKKVAEDESDYEKDYAALIDEHESIDYLKPENNEFKEESLEPSIKLDVARAYIEADDNEAALNILDEILQEGSEEQIKEAEEILSYIRESAQA